ncbi:PriCT-2 domain-containing protein, partial [Halorubrum sp. SP9]
IEEALSHVDPDLPHEEWIKVGFAVHDFDDGSTGKRLFKKWSKRGAKYDDKAERSIDWIWSDASEGAGVT